MFPLIASITAVRVVDTRKAALIPGILVRVWYSRAQRVMQASGAANSLMRGKLEQASRVE
jgi:hypothetical protein